MYTVIYKLNYFTCDYFFKSNNHTDLFIFANLEKPNNLKLAVSYYCYKSFYIPPRSPLAAYRNRYVETDQICYFLDVKVDE